MNSCLLSSARATSTTSRAGHAVPAVRGNLQAVARFHADFAAVLEYQASGAPEQQHPLIDILVVPAFLWRGVTFGDDAFDVDGLGADQAIEGFAGKILGKVTEEIVHGDSRSGLTAS